MSRPKIPTTTVRMAVFASRELTEFVDELYTDHGGFKVSEGDLAAALILAARRSPAEAVKAVVGTYWDREAAEAARIADEA